jgi:hypothetical protein
LGGGAERMELHHLRNANDIRACENRSQDRRIGRLHQDFALVRRDLTNLLLGVRVWLLCGRVQRPILHYASFQAVYCCFTSRGQCHDGDSYDSVFWRPQGSPRRNGGTSLRMSRRLPARWLRLPGFPTLPCSVGQLRSDSAVLLVFYRGRARRTFCAQSCGARSAQPPSTFPPS